MKSFEVIYKLFFIEFWWIMHVSYVYSKVVRLLNAGFGENTALPNSVNIFLAKY